MIILLIAFLFLASGISVNKILLYSLEPELLVAVRMLVAGFLLLILSLVFSRQWSAVYKQFHWFVLIAFFTSFFPPNLKAYALAHMPSAKMAYFGTLDPFVAALYSCFIYKERLSARKWLGIFIGFIGMLILISSASPLEEQLRAFWVLSYPEIAAFFAIVLSRFGWILAQDQLKKGRTTPMQLNGVTMSIAGIVSLFAAWLGDKMVISSFSSVPLAFLKEPPLAYLSSQSQLVGFLVYTVFIGNMLGLTLYAYALKWYSITFIALSGFTIPLLVAFFGWFFLQEPLSSTFFISCIVTFIGLSIFFFDEKTTTG